MAPTSDRDRHLSKKVSKVVEYIYKKLLCDVTMIVILTFPAQQHKTYLYNIAKMTLIILNLPAPEATLASRYVPCLIFPYRMQGLRSKFDSSGG